LYLDSILGVPTFLKTAVTNFDAICNQTTFIYLTPRIDVSEKSNAPIFSTELFPISKTITAIPIFLHYRLERLCIIQATQVPVHGSKARHALEGVGVVVS